MRHQFGQRLLDLRAQQPGVVLQVGEEAGAVRAQHLEHLARACRTAPRRRPPPRRLACCQCASASRSHSSTGVPRIGPVLRPAASPASVGPPPRHAAHGAKLVQHGRHVVLDARRQQVFFPGRCRRGMAFELAQHVGQPAFAFAALVAIAVGQLVPAEQEAHELRRRHRLDLGAQLVARVAVDAREQAAVAPFGGAGGGEGAAHHRAFDFELQQARQHRVAAHAQRRGQRRGSDRPEQFQPAAQDLAQGVVGRGPCRRRPARSAATALRPGTPPATRAGAPPRRSSVPPAATCSARDAALLRERLDELRERALRRRVRKPCTTSASCSSSALPISGQASSRTCAIACGSSRPMSCAVCRSISGLRADGLGAPLLGRAVVEEGVGPRVEDGVRQRRRRRQVARGDARPRRPRCAAAAARSRRRPSSRAGSRAASARPADGRESRARRRGSRAHASWSGNTTVSRSCASERWNCGGTLRPPFMRRTASDAVAFQRQRVPNIGASSSACTSTSRARGRLQVVLHLVQREAVRRAQRQHDAVFQRAGLQLEVELAAHALAQRQAPGLVDARAVRRMDHQVRVAHLVEEALEHDAPLGWAARRARPWTPPRYSASCCAAAAGRCRSSRSQRSQAVDAVVEHARRRSRRAATPPGTARRCGPGSRRARTASSAAAPSRLPPAPCRSPP